MTDNTSQRTSRASGIWRSLLKYGVPLLISIGLCYLLFTGIDFGEMMQTIRNNCDFRWIALALIISIFSHIFRAMRWRIQLKALNINASLYALVLSIFGTYAVNLVLPRLGELWRTDYIARREGAPFNTVFGSMVADRLADTVTVLLLTAVTFIFAGGELSRYLMQDPDRYTQITHLLTSPWLWIGGAAAVGAVIVFFWRMPDNKVVRGVRNFCRGLWEGFSVIARMPGKGRWLLLTLLVWGCYFLQLYVAFFSFPATTQVVADYGIRAVMVCFVLSSISMGVPSNGGIGPWQWAIVFGLSLFSQGIPELTREYATSFANLVMGSQTLLLILLGLYTFINITIWRKRHNHTVK